MDTKELTARLKRHYLKPGDLLPGGVFLTEVMAPGMRAGEEGFERANRRLDALYVGFTAARGRMLEGHEVKVSRADWLSELGSPHKADWWFEHTHRWWVVAAHEGIVEAGELPEGWGLMVPTTTTRTRLKVMVPASVREALVDFGLLLEVAKKMDVLRRDVERADKFELDAKIREGVKDKIASMDASERKYLEREAQTLRASVEEFEQASGVRIRSWGAGDVGKVVARVLAQENTEKAHRRALNGLHDSAKRLVRDVEETVARLDQERD